MKIPSGRDDRVLKYNQIFAKRMKARRQECSISQQKLANAIGVQQPAISSYESGLIFPQPQKQFGMVSPILAIDPIIDIPRTMINVTGSLTNALVVDKMMGNLNLDDYNDMSLYTLDSKANKESAEK